MGCTSLDQSLLLPSMSFSAYPFPLRGHQPREKLFLTGNVVGLHWTSKSLLICIACIWSGKHRYFPTLIYNWALLSCSPDQSHTLQEQSSAEHESPLWLILQHCQWNKTHPNTILVNAITNNLSNNWNIFNFEALKSGVRMIISPPPHD